MTDERTNRLPKWAQQHIANLEREVQGLKNELAAIEGIDSPLTLRYRGYLSEPRGIEEHAILEWNGGTSHRDGITVYFRDGLLNVQSGGQLVVSPRAANLVFVRNEG